MVCYGSVHHHVRTEEQMVVYYRTLHILEAVTGVSGTAGLTSWNDSDLRTREDVIVMLDRAIARAATG